MNYRELIAASKAHLAYASCPTPDIFHMFPIGAQWMYERLEELQPASARPFDENIRYSHYGWLKYSVCLAGSCLSIVVLSAQPLLAIILSIGIFYLLEIHFLFLFPLLIDQVRRPLLTSIRATYKIGIGRCLVNVIPIAGYMLIGLFRRSNRFRNWYIGCLAIIIWYEHDIRNRV